MTNHKHQDDNDDNRDEDDLHQPSEDDLQEKQIVHWRIAEWFPFLNSIQLEKFELYRDELKRFNKKINLISTKTIPFLDVIHFADSILASNEVSKDLETENCSKEVYDFGSGNGFPGVVFAILNSEYQVNLVESDGRKLEFLKHIVAVLNLSQVQVISSRVEKLPDQSVSVAISRGFMPLSNAVLLTRRLFVKGGLFYHLKGEEWPKEVASIPIQVCSAWQPTLLAEYQLPVGKIKFAIIKTKRI